MECTGTGLTWRTDRVCAYRSYHQLPAHIPEARAEPLTLEEAAAQMDICPITLRRLIRRGRLRTSDTRSDTRS